MKKLMEKQKELNKIKRILLKDFEPEGIYFSDDNKILFFPYGAFSIEKNKLVFSLDGFFCNEIYCFQYTLFILEKLYKKNIKPIIGEAFYTVINNEGICVGAIFDHEIYEEIKRLGVSFDDARAIVEARLIDKYNEEEKEGT